MSGNINGLIPSTDVSANGNSESNFFIRKEDPIIINNLIATNITCDSIDINGGILTTEVGGTVLELNGVPIGTGGLVDEIQANAPIVVTGTPQVPILSIQASGVVPGAYNFATINVNSQGIVTSASSGTIPANDDWSNFPAETNVNMANFLINNLGTPLVATDASTKGYVDTLDAQNVKITGAQNVSGVKTFTTDLPQSIIAPTLPAQLVNKAYVDGAIPGTPGLSNVLTVSNSAGSNQINMNSNKIINCLDPTLAQDVATKNYVDTRPVETLSATLIAGNSAGASQINMNNNKIINCLNPTNPQDVATKDYVDNAIPGIPTLSQVLTAGNSAGSNDINMNGHDISSVNDITMSGLLPTITATNIAGNLTITSANTLNMATAGLLTVASGGILSLGGASYTTCENLHIDNSAITKEGGPDITFDDLAGINTINTGTPLTIGCATTVSLQPNQYTTGLTVQNVTNGSQSSTGITVLTTTTTTDPATGINVENVSITDGSTSTANGVSITKVNTKNSVANGLFIDDIQTNDSPGLATAIHIKTVASNNDADVKGLQMGSIASTGATATGINADDISGSGTTTGIKLANVNSTGKNAFGIDLVTVQAKDASTGIFVEGVQGGLGSDISYGININNVYAEAGDSIGITSTATAPAGNAYGLKVSGVDCQGTAYGLHIDNLTSGANSATGIYIGTSISSTTAQGIIQEGSAVNFLGGSTAIGGNSTASQMALSLGGSVQHAVQTFTANGTIARNGGCLVALTNSAVSTITMPASPLNGQYFTVMKNFNGAVTMNGGGNNINGSATFNFSSGAYGIISLYFITGQGWFAHA